VRFVKGSKQLDVGSRVALREAAPIVDGWPDPTAGCVAGEARLTPVIFAM
jgi:hypothetical protein